MKYDLISRKSLDAVVLLSVVKLALQFVDLSFAHGRFYFFFSVNEWVVLSCIGLVALAYGAMERSELPVAVGVAVDAFLCFYLAIFDFVRYIASQNNDVFGIFVMLVAGIASFLLLLFMFGRVNKLVADIAVWVSAAVCVIYAIFIICTTGSINKILHLITPATLMIISFNSNSRR